ncbi:MAG: hypothetical protein LBU66_07390 [Treponema sp.]|jgi:hypothetical protein|nr:hypothetical protein [Treponema sp.]
MKTYRFLFFILLGLLFILVSGCNDPVFYTLSQEVELIEPYVKGSPTNFVNYNGGMYVASGKNLYRYNPAASSNKKGSWDKPSAPGNGDKILQLAATGNRLIGLFYEERGKSIRMYIKLSINAKSWSREKTIPRQIQSVYTAQDLIFIGAIDSGNSYSVYAYSIHGDCCKNYCECPSCVCPPCECPPCECPSCEGEEPCECDLDCCDPCECANCPPCDCLPCECLTCECDPCDCANYACDPCECADCSCASIETFTQIKTFSIDGELSGAAYDGTNYFICTKQAMYIYDDIDLSLNKITDEDQSFMGIIRLEDNSIVAINRDGELFNVTSSGIGNAIAKFEARRATGALAVWRDSAKKPSLLLVGRQEINYSTSTGHTYGYMEITLDNNGGISATSFHEPGKNTPTTIEDSDHERYLSTIGKLPVNHLFQADDGILFASTQKDGVWSYRLRRENRKYWNAEDN